MALSSVTAQRERDKFVEKGSQTAVAVHSINASGAAVDYATSAKQDTIDTSVQSILTELQGKADLDETQPVLVKAAYNAGGDTANARIDAATSSFQIVDYEHHEIHGGSHYFVSGYQDLAIDEVLDFTWQMPDTTKWIHWAWYIATESETNWLVYEGVTATNPLANSITPLNSNRNSANTSGTTMKYEIQNDLAAANNDTAVGAATLIQSGISGDGKTGGEAKRSNEIILKQNTLYCLRAIASSAGYVNFNMQWYEHTHHN